MREFIKNKALKCIDEVYPEDNSLNVQNFPVEDFLDEAGRRIVRMAPVHVLGRGQEMMPYSRHRPHADGSGTVALPNNFIRLVSFRMEGWERPVTTPIRPDHPLYRKQHNRITRGGPVKPVAALVKGDTELEYYSVPPGVAHEVKEALFYGFSSVDAHYPPSLIDGTAWQLAALVLSSMNDIAGAKTAQDRTNELIALL